MSIPEENVLFRLFGVANLYANPDNKRKILNYIYRFAFFLILLHTPRGVIKLQYNVIQNGNIVLSTKVFIETVTYWLTLYVSYMNIFFHDDKITLVKSFIAEMSNIFPMSRTTQRNQVLALWSVLLILLACQIVYYILAVIFSASEVTAFFSYFLNKFTVNLMSYQFFYLLWIIRHFYREINERLKSLKSGNHSSNFQRIEMCNMKKCYNDLTIITKVLSEAYSLHIFLIVTSTVVETICSLNGLLFLQESCQGDTYCIYYNILNSLLWFCNFNAPTILMVFTCSSIIDEVGNTQKLVLDIELESYDEALISAAENFSLQIKLNRPTFTGYGCFDVDKKMLLTNASTALTYLIIQKQFAFDGLYTSYTGF